MYILLLFLLRVNCLEFLGLLGLDQVCEGKGFSFTTGLYFTCFYRFWKCYRFRNVDAFWCFLTVSGEKYKFPKSTSFFFKLDSSLAFLDNLAKKINLHPSPQLFMHPIKSLSHNSLLLVLKDTDHLLQIGVKNKVILSTSTWIHLRRCFLFTLLFLFLLAILLVLAPSFKVNHKLVLELPGFGRKQTNNAINFTVFISVFLKISALKSPSHVLQSPPNSRISLPLRRHNCTRNQRITAMIRLGFRFLGSLWNNILDGKSWNEFFKGKIYNTAIFSQIA